MTDFSLADIGTVLGNREGGCFGGGSGAVVLIILFAIIFGFGGLGFGGQRGGSTQAEMQSGFSTSEIIGKLDRLGDGLSSLGYTLQGDIMGGFGQMQRDMCTSFATISSQISSCCCETNRNIDQLRYDGAMNTASINSNTTAQTQKVLDAICGLRMEMKDDRAAQMAQRISQLELQSALCGVVRYPNSTAYSAGVNPYFANGCSCA